VADLKFLWFRGDDLRNFKSKSHTRNQ